MQAEPGDQFLYYFPGDFAGWQIGGEDADGVPVAVSFLSDDVVVASPAVGELEIDVSHGVSCLLLGRLVRSASRNAERSQARKRRAVIHR